MLNLQTERLQDRHSSSEQLATFPDFLFFFFFYQFVPERLPSSRRPSEWPSQVKLALAMVCSRPVGRLRVLSKSASSFFFFPFLFFPPSLQSPFFTAKADVSCFHVSRFASIELQCNFFLGRTFHERRKMFLFFHPLEILESANPS